MRLVFWIGLLLSFYTQAFAYSTSGLNAACEQTKNCSTKTSEFLRQSSNTCSIESKALKCDELAHENPQIGKLIRHCDEHSLCSENKEYQDHKIRACLRGYKNALVDTGIALKDLAIGVGHFVEKSWEQAKQNREARVQFVAQCEKSLACKRDLVKDDPRFKNLSDKELNEMTAAFLFVEVEDRKAYVISMDREKFHPVNLPQGDNELSEEHQAKLFDLAGMIEESLRKRYQKYSCYNPLAQMEMACYAVGNVVDPTMLVGAAFKGVRLVAAVGEISDLGKAADAGKLAEVQRAGSAAERSAVVARPAFIEKYLKYNPTTVAENEEWISTAEKGVDHKALFLDVENSQMKSLNDSLKDKNLVTAVTNYHKSIVMDKISELKNEFPEMSVNQYSDFKSLRFAFSGKTPADLQARLEKIFKEANAELTTYLKSNKLIRNLDKSEDWFRAGRGQSAEQANLAARYSRQTDSNVLQAYKSEQLQATMGAKIHSIESDRVKLRQSLADTSMLDGNTLHEEVFDIVRKNMGNDEAISKALSQRYALKEIAPNTVTTLQNYVKASDEFSPGLFIAKRENANLNDAVHGGFSADIIGLGASNMKGTAEALAKSKTVDSAIEEARRQEKVVTTQVNEQKKYFQEVVHRSVDPGKLKTTCSGDDCVAIATKPLNSNEKQKILDGLADSKYSAKFRFAFVGDGIESAEARNTLSNHGEAVEKILRKSLGSVMEPRKLQGLTFGMDMQTQELNQGAVKLLIGKAPGVNLTTSEKTLIQQKFKEALQELNTSFEKQGKLSRYQATP